MGGRRSPEDFHRHLNIAECWSRQPRERQNHMAKRKGEWPWTQAVRATLVPRRTAIQETTPGAGLQTEQQSRRPGTRLLAAPRCSALSVRLACSYLQNEYRTRIRKSIFCSWRTFIRCQLRNFSDECTEDAEVYGRVPLFGGAGRISSNDTTPFPSSTE